MPTDLLPPRGGRNPSLLKAHPRRAGTHPLPPSVIPAPDPEFRSPSPGVEGRLTLSPVEGSSGGSPALSIRRTLPPKSDTNPLTPCEQHVLYSPPTSSSLTLTISRRNQKPREAHPTHPRTQRPSPSQRPIHGARGSSNRRHLLIPRVPCTLPCQQAMEDAWTEP